MKRFVLFNRREYRESSDGAGYWNDQHGWTTLEGATVFAEHELSDASVRGLGAVRVPAPPLRLGVDAAASAIARLQVGDIVWVHDPESAALQVGQTTDALLDGHYTWLGGAGDGLVVLAYPNGSRFTLPESLVLPSPVNAPVDALRTVLDASAKVFAAVMCDEGEEWLRVQLPGSWPAAGGPPTGWRFDDSAGMTLCATSALWVDWPVRFVPGDVVAYRDPDVGACSAIAVWLAPEDGAEADTEIARLRIGGEVQEVPRCHVHATPFAHARQAVEASIVRHRIAHPVRVTCADAPVDGEEAEAVLRVRIECDDAPADVRESIAVAVQRAGFTCETHEVGFMASQALDQESAPWMSESDVEAWGLIAPDDGGYFESEDVEDAPACTVWAVIEEADESLTLRAGFCRFDAVLGYVRTERPWVTGLERAIWLHGVDAEDAAVPSVGTPALG